MAFSKKILEVIKTKIIPNYGKRSFHSITKTFAKINHEGASSKETHFGFETVKETEKAEKGMTGQILVITSN
jgi:hypothetical protein